MSRPRPRPLRLGAAACALAVALGVAACDSSESVDRPAPPPPRAETAPTPADEPAPPTPARSPAEELIQGWLAALQLKDYRRAGSYFARNALVDQGTPFRLATRADAIDFNRSLPCTALLTDVRRERRTVLATFLLSDGPGGTCSGSVRVRFEIRDGRFTSFRQLLDDPHAPSVSA